MASRVKLVNISDPPLIWFVPMGTLEDPIPSLVRVIDSPIAVKAPRNQSLELYCFLQRRELIIIVGKSLLAFAAVACGIDRKRLEWATRREERKKIIPGKKRARRGAAGVLKIENEKAAPRKADPELRAQNTSEDLNFIST